MENNNSTSGGNEKNSQSRDANSKGDTQNKKMWASSDRLLKSTNGLESGNENIELTTQDSGPKQCPYTEGLFFRDEQKKEQKKIDFVLVYESSEDAEDPKAAIRKKYQDNLIEHHGLELEEETSRQVLRFYLKISSS